MTPEEQASISQFLAAELNTTEDFVFKAFKGGASNLTYSVKADQHEWIMRTSPPGTKAKGAHDMNREYHLLKKLHPNFDLCPEVVLFCGDETIFPREFYLMKPINGIIIRQQLPAVYQDADLSLLCKELIDVHVQLHQAPTTELQNFNKGPGYIERQISGWVHRYSRVTPTADIAQPVIKWLSNNMPQDNRDYTLIHNDYKFDNVVFDPTNTHKIIGVLDWEMTTIGDPLMDLGCSLAYWFEANDHEAMQKISMMPTYLDGMMTRDELVHQYSLSSGLTIDDYHFYYIYGLFRLAVIVQQIFYRYERGQTDNPAFKPMGMIRDLILKQALAHLK
ncbi:phosphotransferase family protein [Marinicella sp. S1101]|uniref:phosphotransferase family protein n=1 Tax=Marinicella marina TaxID=2996016 RepID=UPI002260C6C0|nr:phosphotransferase family protein [Marinicella marina]MCX7554742.1 phosphotransferase family protein [Marinicella marina]MDJ1141442.1 phosphotransferase family protein [Marinicella marina]